VTLRSIRGKLTAFQKSERGRLVLRWTGRAATAVIVAVLFYQLSTIGWSEIVRHLPRNPFFYALLLVIYVSLPFAETFIYRKVLDLPPRQSFLPLLKKRVYNEDVLGHSGEAYLFFWARSLIPGRDGDIIRAVRDVNIISIFNSYSFAFALAFLVMFTGYVDTAALFDGKGKVYLGAGLSLLVLVLAVLFRMRRYFFAMPLPLARSVYFIHFVRIVSGNALLLLQWTLGAPEVPFRAWLVYLCVLVFLNRLPFLPSRDLVFLSAGVELARVMELAVSPVASMLLVNSALVKVINAGILLAVLVSDGRSRPSPRDDSAGDTPAPSSRKGGS
jgi:hypothetical protein